MLPQPSAKDVPARDQCQSRDGSVCGRPVKLSPAKAARDFVALTFIEKWETITVDAGAQHRLYVLQHEVPTASKPLKLRASASGPSAKVRRLQAGYRSKGPAALVHDNRGGPLAHRMHTRCSSALSSWRQRKTLESQLSPSGRASGRMRPASALPNSVAPHFREPRLREAVPVFALSTGASMAPDA